MNNTASKEFDWDSSHDLLDLIVQKISDDPDGMDNYIVDLYKKGSQLPATEVAGLLRAGLRLMSAHLC